MSGSSEILSRLEIAGTTHVGGDPKYANQLPVLNSNGFLDPSFNSGSGGLTNIGLSTNASWFTVGNSPLVENGTINLNLTTGLTANQVLVTPNGSTGTLSLRSLVLTDLPGTVTAQGNIFNGANELLKLSGAALVPTANLATGTADSTTFLRGDGTWQVPAGGGGGGGSVTSINVIGADSHVTSSGGPVTNAGSITVGLNNVAFTDTAVTFSSSVAASSFAGNGASLTSLNATNLSSGLVNSSVLGTGTASNTTYLRGDGTWNIPPTNPGTVTSVSQTVPTGFSVSGSPITSTGTLAISYTTGQTANQFLATPNGSTGSLGLRNIVVADIPTLNQNTTGNAATVTGLSIVSGKTLTASNSLTLAGTDGSTLNVGTGGTLGTAAYTASSSYAPAVGSTAITTLGTITTGTWNADVIGLTYLPLATPFSPGIIIPDGSTITISGGVISAVSTGSVTSFSAGSLSPLFTTSVATATTTPALSFALTSAAQNSVFAGPASGGAGAPSYQTAPTISGANLTALPTSTGLYPTFNQSTTGNAANVTGVVALANGGSGQTTAALAYPVFYKSVATTLGDLVYGGTAGAPTRLVGKTTAGAAVLSQTGTGSASAAPVWNAAPAISGASLTALPTTVGLYPTLNQNTTGTASNLSGTPALPNGTTATTQTSTDNSTKLATTAFVKTLVGTGSFHTIAQQTFTTSGTYTPTSGMVYCIVQLAGGGGGGGGSQSTGSTISLALGGQGGGYAEGLFDAATISTSQTVTIGSAGTGGAGNTVGVDGTSTSLGSLITATGGKGGSAGVSTTTQKVFGPSASNTAGTGGYLNRGGDNGTAAITTQASSSLSGAGGSSPFGQGGLGVAGNSNGVTGNGSGTGGSGSNSSLTITSFTGGNGTSGIVIITEFCT